MFQDIRVILI